MKRVATTAAAILRALAMGVASGIPSAYAAGKSKVDCDAVMNELNSGKKAKEVAKDLGISVTSVYRCKKKAKKNAEPGGATPGSEAASPAASPAAAPKPKP